MADAFVGEIRLFAGNFAPRDWALCDGGLMPIAQNTVLFSILGARYGGDGRTNFALPDLRGRAAMAAGQGLGLTPRSEGASGGTGQVALLATEMPRHTHAAQASTRGGSTTSQGNIWGTGTRGTGAYAPTSNVAMNAAALQMTGQGSPHDNRQPYLGMNFIICLRGEYPPRS